MSNKPTDESILKMVRGFMTSRVVISAAELDLFTLLAEKGRTADEVADAIDADLRGITILLDALCALGFLVKTDGTYTFEEIASGLAAAGFVSIRQIQSKAMLSLVEGLFFISHP